MWCLWTKHSPKWGQDRNRSGIPELELGEAADEGLELVGAAGGEPGPGLERLELRVDHGGEEADEEVEQVDAQPVGDDVEAPHVVDPQRVHRRGHERARPPPRRVRSRAVQVVLERPRRLRAPPLRRAAVADGGGLHGRRLGSSAGWVRFRAWWNGGAGALVGIAIASEQTAEEEDFHVPTDPELTCYKSENITKTFFFLKKLWYFQKKKNVRYSSL